MTAALTLFLRIVVLPPAAISADQETRSGAPSARDRNPRPGASPTPRNPIRCPGVRCVLRPAAGRGFLTWPRPRSKRHSSLRAKWNVPSTPGEVGRSLLRDMQISVDGVKPRRQRRPFRMSVGSATGRAQTPSGRNPRNTCPAGFLRIEMLPKILQGVRGQPLSKCHAGLCAPPHHSELIDVEVSCPRSTTEWSFAILDQALTVAVRFLGHSVSKQLFDLRVDGELLGGQPHLAVFIVKDQKTGCEPARLRKLDDLQNFLTRRSPNDGADDHVELCTFSQYVELPSQHVKDLAGCRVPFHPIDAQTHIGHATIC